jgi:GTP-binding protein
MEMNIGGLNLHNTDLIITAGLPSQLIKSGIPQVAFSGRSNVGKSSLINCLLGRKKLARTSSTPGKTITVNYYRVDKKMTLVDLPGYGYANRSHASKKQWSALTQGYFEDNSSLTLVAQLIDSKVGVTKDDEEMIQWLNYYDIPYVVVITKCDKLNKTELNASAEKILSCDLFKSQTPCILFSSEKKLGREGLWELILKNCFKTGE